jgi:hypothetical protein
VTNPGFNNFARLEVNRETPNRSYQRGVTVIPTAKTHRTDVNTFVFERLDNVWPQDIKFASSRTGRR